MRKQRNNSNKKYIRGRICEKQQIIKEDTNTF